MSKGHRPTEVVMPIHDWTRVEAGIFHHFHHSWIEEIQRALNNGILPPQYYAMAEQHTRNYGPDVLALERTAVDSGDLSAGDSPDAGDLLVAEPKTTWSGETEMAFYRRKQSSVAIRHVSGDEVIAMIEIVSPGNKSGRKAVNEFVDKACMLLKNDIHLLVLDVLPPGSSDPQGMHGEIWEALEGVLPDDLGKPFVFSSYEADVGVRAFAEAADLGDPLPDMPLFLLPRKHVLVPLEKIYDSAFAALPRRWRDVVAAE
jgi:uncharacterized protein DUF4058